MKLALVLGTLWAAREGYFQVILSESMVSQEDFAEELYSDPAEAAIHTDWPSALPLHFELANLSRSMSQLYRLQHIVPLFHHQPDYLVVI